ncbi:hypothetical protein VTI28DRAFT_1279 [Corynascus sepedonium]
MLPWNLTEACRHRIQSEPDEGKTEPNADLAALRGDLKLARPGLAGETRLSERSKATLRRFRDSFITTHLQGDVYWINA